MINMKIILMFLNKKTSEKNTKEKKMKKYFYFLLGYIMAFMTMLFMSCSYSPLQADYNTPGHSAAFPLFVKHVE